MIKWSGVTGKSKKVDFQINCKKPVYYMTFNNVCVKNLPTMLVIGTISVKTRF